MLELVKILFEGWKYSLERPIGRVITLLTILPGVIAAIIWPRAWLIILLASLVLFLLGAIVNIVLELLEGLGILDADS